jgi:hypothetical protein
MLPVNVQRRVEQINYLFDKARKTSNDDPEIQAHWAKYLCVLCAGLVETSVPEIFGKRAKAKAEQRIADFVLRSLEKVQNPKCSKLIEVAGRFHKDWAVEIDKYVSADGRREAVDAIMQHRNQIAHGRKSDITLVRLKDIFKKAVTVLEHIEHVVK